MNSIKTGDLIDTHAHLCDKAFDRDLKEVIARARETGIQKIITIAESESLWQPVVELAETYEFIYAGIGVHPHEADEYGTEELRAALQSKLEHIVLHPKAAVVGETGLDYFKQYSTVENQKNLFLLHLNVSKKTGKPLSIHCRDAYPDLIEILKNIDNSITNSHRGVIHCFSGTKDDAKLLCDMDFYLGIDGPVTYPKSEQLRDIVKHIPLDKLLLETDCPYLAPQRVRGKRNEPMYLPSIAEEVSRIKQISIADVCRTTTANAITLMSA